MTEYCPHCGSQEFSSRKTCSAGRYLHSAPDEYIYDCYDCGDVFESPADHPLVADPEDGVRANEEILFHVIEKIWGSVK